MFKLLIVPPKIVPFSFGEEAFHAGQPVSLQCSIAEGDQPMNVTWYKESDLLQGNSYNITITKLSRHLSILSIEEVEAYHIGNYTCSAKNKAAVSNHTATLYVNGSSQIVISVIHFHS